MKFRASRQALLEAFQVAGSVVSSRAIRPILGCVHLVVHQDRAEASATDLEIAIRYRLPVLAVVEPGEAVVPAARLTAILRECSSDEVELDSDSGGKIHLVSGSSSFQLLSEHPEEFPRIPEFPDAAAFGLNRDKLVSLIRKTSFAVAKEKSRFAFNGAKLHIEGNEARMIATDGKRLAMMVEEIDNSDGVEAGHIVPARALQVFEKVLGEEDDLVRIALDDKEIMLKTTRAEISSRLVDGSFPNYKAVIPETCAFTVGFDREELIRAFRQAALLTNQETRSVRMKLVDGRATLSAQALDAGEARIDLDAPDHQGEEFVIAFNPDFIVEGLKVVAGERVQIGLSRSNMPAKITGDGSFVYVVMPVTMRNG
ncbi:MAG: DNA polymerase III subunit beta [Planctomycetes bacterium]|nr:DNA polymerase III subunit beta [Planctomycetota bacterium]